VKLFVERAQRHLEGFGLTADNAPDVARICRLLDGMPLGVVLAAGWMDVLSPAEIADEIEGGMDFLETDLRNVPQRQRSVRAVFDHSWNMLSPREREVMAALSVFRGGFTRRAAAAVAGATLRELKGLAGKSLLHMAAASSGTTSTSGRYEVHELLRQYAAEKLAQSPTALDATRDRHCAYFAGFLGRRAEALKGPGQLTAVAEIEADAENGLAAWNRATESDQVERLEQAMEGLCLFYQWRGRYEQGDRACETAEGHLAGLGEHQLAPPWNAAPMRARLLAWRGLFNFHLGRHETAQQLLGKSLSLIDEAELAGHDLRRERAFVLRGSGNATLYLGHYTRAGDLFQQSLALCREMDDRWATAHALIGASWAAWNLASYREMEELLRESLALRRALGDRRGIAESLYGLSLPLTWQGKNDESNRLAQESVAISRETGDWANLGWGLEIIALGLEFGGKLTEAQSVLEERKMICEELGDQAALASAIFLLGDLQLHLGQYEDASVQLQSSLRLARETGYTRAMACSLLGLGRVRLAEGAYTEAKPWIQEGLGLIQVSGPQTELDWALVYLALTELGLGNRRQARKFCHQAFETAIKQITSLHLPDAVALMALLLADENEGERAETLFALACRYPRVGKSQWWEDVAGKRIAAVATTLPPDVVAAAQERGRARDLDATVRELLEELEA
jgi:tetratricopeptide (TPR) repeat protein